MDPAIGQAGDLMDGEIIVQHGDELGEATLGEEAVGVAHQRAIGLLVAQKPTSMIGESITAQAICMPVTSQSCSTPARKPSIT